MSKARALKKILLVILCNFIILLLILVLLEGGLRFLDIPYKVEWTPTENAVAQFDEELGWAYIPNTSKTVQYGSRTVDIHFDSNGIRVPNPEYKFDYQQRSVLFIGGSFAMGHGLSYEESFAGQFGAFHDVPFQVVNLGVQAYGSDQAFLTLKKYFQMFNTKVVVYTFINAHIKRNGNYDRRFLLPRAEFLGTKPLFSLNRKKELYLAKKPLLYEDYVHSYLLDLIKMRVGARLGNYPPYPEELTKAIIREIRKYCAENGVHFVMINWRMQEGEYSDFRDLGIDIIDTLDNAPSDWKHMVIPDDGHPNVEANSRVARLLLNYFQRKSLLKTK